VTGGERESLTVGQLIRAGFALVIIVLLLIELGYRLRRDDPAPPFAASESAAAPGLGPAGAGRSQRDAELAEAMKALMDDGGLFARDPSALDKTMGAPVVLMTAETELRVTPTRITVATAACAAGPLVTVELLVESLSGTEALPLNDFHLRAHDGSVAEPIPACSTGFAEAAAKRTVVFAAATPDRLLFGTNPASPEAQWFLA
jgi:hypothetical protein